MEYAREAAVNGEKARRIEKGMLVLCPVYMIRETQNRLTECYRGDLFLGVVEEPEESGMVIVNLSPLGKYKAPNSELVPVVQTDGSPKIFEAIETIENHSKRTQKSLHKTIALLIEEHY